MYTFGKDISYTLYAYESGDKLPVIPSQSYSVHVYKQKPERVDAFTGVGSENTINATHVSSNVLTFTVPAIDDPDPDSQIKSYTYYLAIIFKLQDSEQSQLIIRALPIERVHGKDKTIGVTVDKILEAYPNVLSYLAIENLEAFIKLAQTELLSDLANKGFLWAEINRPEQLFNALLFKSLFYVHSSQIQRDGDRFSVGAEIAAKSYDNTIRNLKLDIGADDETPKKESAGGVVWLLR